MDLVSFFSSLLSSNCGCIFWYPIPMNITLVSLKHCPMERYFSKLITYNRASFQDKSHDDEVVFGIRKGQRLECFCIKMPPSELWFPVSVHNTAFYFQCKYSM